MIRRRKRNYDDPLLHPDHSRPRTRREFLSQGFILGGAGAIFGTSAATIGGNAFALSGDLAPLVSSCGIATQGAGKIPFICFDLAGGSNQAGSNVLVGQQGGQLDFLSTQGYERQGLPGDMIPPIVNANTQTRDNIDQQLGLAFHSDSAFLRGMLVGTLVTIIALFFTDLDVQYPLLTLSVVFLSSVVFALAGFINAVFARKFDDISIVPTFVLTPLIYLGGVFYSISLLPEPWKTISLANPILYMVNAFRFGILGISDIDIGTAYAILIFFSVLLFTVCLQLMRRGVGIRE